MIDSVPLVRGLILGRREKNRALPQKSSRNLHTIMKRKPERKISFIVALFLCGMALNAPAQRPVFNKLGVLPQKFEWKDPVRGQQNVENARFYDVLHSNRQFPGPGRINIVQKPVRADLYVQNLGFFCKKEWEFEKSVHIPIRFRLGSLEYCNYLEGKK